MKKKILFNIAFVLVAVFCIIFAACFIKSANSQFETVKYYNNLDEEFGISQSTIQQHQRLGIKFSLYATMSLLIVCFMIFSAPVRLCGFPKLCGGVFRVIVR